MAQQDAERWLLLPSAAESKAKEPAIVTELASELRQQGLYPLAFDEARLLFERRHSAAPQQVSDSDLALVRKETESALVHVATGRTSRAREAVSKVLERAESALESLNRELDSARHVLNACLYLVRAMLENDNRSAAKSRARECRRLVPDIEPDPHDHPPEVMELLRQVETELATAPTGRLTIRSTPSGCQVYLNGRELGQTPYEIRDLPPGDYRIQAECGEQAGRVHRITLAAEPTVVHIDTRFDRAVRTKGYLGLTYADAETQRRYRFPDALQVARVLDAQYALVMSPVEGGEALRLDRIDVESEQVGASVKVPAGAEASKRQELAASALEALVAGRSLDLTGGGEGAPIEAWTPPEPPDDAQAKPHRRRGQEGTASASGGSASGGSGSGPSGTTEEGRGTPDDKRADRGLSTAQATGVAMDVVGFAGLMTSWGLWARLQTRNTQYDVAEPMDADYLARQRRVDAANTHTLVVGSISGALTTAGMPLLLPERDGVPWWAWAVGAAGAGLVAYGLVPAGGGDLPPVERQCIDPPECTRRQQTPTLGALMVFHGAPMLAVPLTYAVRALVGGDDGEQASAAVRIGPNRAELQLGGTF